MTVQSSTPQQRIRYDRTSARIAPFQAPAAPETFHIAMVVPPYFDVPPKAYGGVEAVVADLVDALIERGHEVTLFGAGEPGTRARFVPVWDRIQADRLGDPFPEVVHALKVRRALEEVMARDGIDLVHDHTFAGPLSAPFYAGLGLPTVVTVHGPVDGDPYTYYRELGEDVSLVAISDRQRELAPDLNWAGRVHNALRVADWPFCADKSDYALFLGRFSECKAPHLALEAAHAAGMPLVLAGKCNEPAEKAYFDEAVRPLLTERDHVFGMADAAAKRKLLSEAKCLLFPVQWEEPFGMVMIEAMVCGTPVVALRGGAVSEVIVDGVTGRVCDDPAELPIAMREVQEYDPAACREHVLANFSADTLGRGYEQVYRRALRARRSRRMVRAATRIHALPTTSAPGAMAGDPA
ncbi:glycosyl transferase [Nocardia wallacei]|uniref:Glycosyl transferase n=2 Tax=Nocardia wallacei TaxID=480035 RepID=A0A7G1KD00_9NOCA|nr:glycosyl transferase [Nocardia wallacei]